MATYEFELHLADRLADVDTDDVANRLYDAGCDDGMLAVDAHGHATVIFGRDALTFTEAIRTAIHQVETAGLAVDRVEPDELVSAADIAERTGRSRQSISNLVAGVRGPGGWPPPAARHDRSPLWRWEEVAAWFERYDGSQHGDPARARTIEAMNAALDLRRVATGDAELAEAVGSVLVHPRPTVTHAPDSADLLNALEAVIGAARYPRRRHPANSATKNATSRRRRAS